MGENARFKNGHASVKKRVLPVVLMALQTEKNYFQINYASRSRYRYRRISFWKLFPIADAETAVPCSLEGAA